jgi:polysaccharide chain length determinant protein (PEP-CTERM system associated)
VSARGPADGRAPAGASDPDDGDSIRWSEVRHFLHAPLRRPFMVLLPWLGVFLVAVAALWLLPRKYLSSALVLVESEKVPESFIAKVATRDASQRLEAVKPEILSRTRLERVLQETQPYPDLSRTRGVELMRERISITLSGNDGFTISFFHHDPRIAQRVTDRLASLFIEETIKAREQQVEGAVDFLLTQLNESRRELEGKDAALRRFKEEHMGRLPSQLDANLATMQMLQREAQMIEENLLFARVKQETLARGLGRPSGAAAASASGELTDLTRQLAALKARYTDAHPDVESLRSRIRRLEARLADAAAEDASGGGSADPTLAVTREQLERANVEIRSLERRQKDIQARMAVIRANVEETPRTEQELSTLTRDYDKLNENYTALLAKQLEAQMSGRLESRWKGDQFRMLDPASLPEKAMFPKAGVFLPLGAVLGLVIGIAASLVAEYLDETVKDAEVLQAIQGYPLLASIPHLPDLAGPGPPRAMIAARAKPEDEGRRRAAAELAWGPCQPGEIAIRHAGVVVSRKAVPIVESLNVPGSIVGEELRLFGSNLVDTCRRFGMNCVALTSALPEEGKSTVCLGLASALARKGGRRILLVDADLRRQSLARMLGVPPTEGLSEWLNGTLDHVPVLEVEPGGFFFVSAGRSGLERPELMGSPRMDAFLKTARRLFDLVLLDGVPVLPVADTVLMQDLVDGFQLVVRSRTTPRDAIRDTLAKLRPDKVIGVVFNDHREYRASYRYARYSRYATGDGGAPGSGAMGRRAEGSKGRV